MQELDDEALGWFSRRLPWGSYGMLCRASLGSPDLGVAIKRWCRHHRLLTDDITLALHRWRAASRPCRSRSIGALGDVPRVLPGLEPALPARLRLLGHRFARLAARGQLSLRGAAAPRRLSADVRRRSCTSAPTAASYSFDERYLALPLQRDERALRTMLRRALPLTVLQYRRDRLLGQRVRELLRTRGRRGGHGRGAGGAAQPVGPHAAPPVAGGRRLAAGAEGRGAARAGRRAVAPHRAADQADRAGGGLSQREELFARLPRLGRGARPGAFRRAAHGGPARTARMQGEVDP